MLTNCTLKNTHEKHHPHFQMQAKLGMAVHASDPSIYEWEAGDFEFKASLGYSISKKKTTSHFKIIMITTNLPFLDLLG